jgi:alpha-D-ribose 1-methylphosphonate 5-triphosphate synthase subunit PhnH
MGALNDDPRALAELPLGFADPVADAQAVFRAALRALSHPGEVVECGAIGAPVEGLMPATAALLLALTDTETRVWWAAPGPVGWLRFHTGAPPAARAQDAPFAVFGLGQTLPPLGALDAGSDESPERSTTLLIELPSFEGGVRTEWFGPGLREPRQVALAGLPEPFWADWLDNHAAFPSGVDVFFVCGRSIVGLPRTTHVRVLAELR